MQLGDSVLAWCTQLCIWPAVFQEEGGKQGGDEAENRVKQKKHWDTGKVNEAENRKLVEKLNKTKSWGF